MLNNKKYEYIKMYKYFTIHHKNVLLFIIFDLKSKIKK